MEPLGLPLEVLAVAVAEHEWTIEMVYDCAKQPWKRQVEERYVAVLGLAEEQLEWL